MGFGRSAIRIFLTVLLAVVGRAYGYLLTKVEVAPSSALSRVSKSSFVADPGWKRDVMELFKESIDENA